ncbi:MAG: MinD/ParA family protein [Desulfobacterales bacterium]|nr:MinD/ParA family protein [Desulfobacterales bacterium]
MNPNPPKNNIISLPIKSKVRKAASPVPERSNTAGTRVIAVTSGKGGVGKSNIVANLAYTLTRLGKKVLVFDADLGLGNLDVLLGQAPRYNISHVIKGEKNIDEITMLGPGGMLVLPASSGVQDMTELLPAQRVRILSALDTLMKDIDVMLIDTAAGISSNVMYFNVTAQEVIVVVTPEPTSITDAYALMKVMSLKYAEKKFNLLVNMVSGETEAKDVYRQLSMVSKRFLDISIDYLGYIPRDGELTRCVRGQKLVREQRPSAIASGCFDTIARSLDAKPAPRLPAGYASHFWKYLIGKKFDEKGQAYADR